MEIFIILVLCILATSKVTVSGFFAKNNINTFADGIFFNGLIFLFAAVIFSKNAINCDSEVIIFGTIFGILTVLFQLSYIKAMSCGNVSLTVMIVNLSMIIPITVSIVFYHEKIGITRIIGIILTVVALILSVDNKEKGLNFKKWFLLCMCAFFANAGLAICQKAFGETGHGSQAEAFVAWGYITATIASALVFVILKTKGQSITFKIKPSVFGFALCIGIILGLFQLLNTKAIANIDGTLLFPSYYGGSLILSSISSVVILKERLNFSQKVSLLIGIASIVLMNL